MPNVQLPESRQRRGSAIIYTGLFVGLGGCIGEAILHPWTDVPLVIAIFGVAIVFVGAAYVTVKVVCPNCGRRCLICGRPTRMNCAYCGAPYYADLPVSEKAG
jgi:hypothetical protein